MPCICACCGERFDRSIIRPGERMAQICEECGGFLCPTCGSHAIYDIAAEAIAVPARFAASIRASVWGRAN
jgi:hypothetical protein